jgi:hypothetical protein
VYGFQTDLHFGDVVISYMIIQPDLLSVFQTAFELDIHTYLYFWISYILFKIPPDNCGIECNVSIRFEYG